MMMAKGMSPCDPFTSVSDCLGFVENVYTRSNWLAFFEQGQITTLYTFRHTIVCPDLLPFMNLESSAYIQFTNCGNAHVLQPELREVRITINLCVTHIHVSQ